MIKFFRNIRRALLTENKFSKYLLYAIGEIVLVVIGILIALQINNWNEDQKNDIREQFYLQSLMDDMQNNLDEIQEDISDNKNVIESCNFLLDLARSRNYQEVEDSIIEKQIISLGNYAKLQLEQGTIEEIMSSGSLQTIKNDTLRGILVDWDRSLIAIKEMEQFARNNQERYILYLNTFVPYYAFDYMEIKYPPNIRDQYFQNTELLNTVADIRFVARVLNIEYETKIKEINELVSLLKRGLEE